MEKKDFLKYCRYYKGEKECPYKDTDPNKSMLWFYERSWLIDIGNVAEDSNTAISEYINSGLGLFEQFDGIPLSLKSYLFNRYAKTCNSLADAVEPFKVFYKKYY